MLNPTNIHIVDLLIFLSSGIVVVLQWRGFCRNNAVNLVSTMMQQQEQDWPAKIYPQRWNIARRALSHGTTLDRSYLFKIWVICVLVSLVLVFFGVFSTELLTSHCKNTKSESLDSSIDFFALFHIVCHRYASKKVPFNSFNTIWPLSKLVFGRLILIHLLRYCLNNIIDVSDKYEAWGHSEPCVSHVLQMDHLVPTINSYTYMSLTPRLPPLNNV